MIEVNHKLAPVSYYFAVSNTQKVLSNIVISRLRADHINIARLLSFVARQAEKAAGGFQVDLETVTRVAEYLADYPALQHHPLEDAICDRLKRSRPALATSADGIVREHRELDLLISQFRALLDRARTGREVSIVEFAETANALVNAELAHMARENSDLFPAALAVLSHADWVLMEERAAWLKDPLFGPSPAPQFDGLRQMLVQVPVSPDPSSQI